MLTIDHLSRVTASEAPWLNPAALAHVSILLCASSVNNLLRMTENGKESTVPEHLRGCREECLQLVKEGRVDHPLFVCFSRRLLPWGSRGRRRHVIERASWRLACGRGRPVLFLTLVGVVVTKRLTRSYVLSGSSFLRLNNNWDSGELHPRPSLAALLGKRRLFLLKTSTRLIRRWNGRDLGGEFAQEFGRWGWTCVQFWLARDIAGGQLCHHLSHVDGGYTRFSEYVLFRLQFAKPKWIFFAFRFVPLEIITCLYRSSSMYLYLDVSEPTEANRRIITLKHLQTLKTIYRIWFLEDCTSNAETSLVSSLLKPLWKVASMEISQTITSNLNGLRSEKIRPVGAAGSLNKISFSNSLESPLTELFDWTAAVCSDCSSAIWRISSSDRLSRELHCCSRLLTPNLINHPIITEHHDNISHTCAFEASLREFSLSVRYLLVKKLFLAN